MNTLTTKELLRLRRSLAKAVEAYQVAGLELAAQETQDILNKLYQAAK
jgi:hypothetical protein